MIKNDDSHAPLRVDWYQAYPFAAARYDPGRVEDAFKSAAWGMVLVGGPVGGTCFGMGGGRSRCGPLSPSRPSRTCVQVRVDPVGPARPADLAVVGRKPSYPSRIRATVEREWLRGAPPAEGLVAPPWPARRRSTASGLRGKPEPAGPSGHGRRARDGAVRRAAAVTALLGRLAECALLGPACRVSPAWAMLVAPVVSTLGGSLAATRASR